MHVRRFVRSTVAGGAVALVIELALLTSTGGMLHYEPLGDVFDGQAHALLDGRWDVPPDVVKIEGFLIDGRTYTYFGPVPALLRMPIAAATDRLDGRLTRTSMLLAWFVTVGAAIRLLWRIAGERWRAGTPSRAMDVAVAFFVLAVGAGSSVAYLGSRPSVFHEAIAWGVAFALVAIEAVLAWEEKRTPSRFALALALVTAALLTRASVGAAPALTLAFVLGADGIGRLRRHDGRGVLRIAGLGATLVLPLVLYAVVNQAKFGTFFTLPYDRHIVSMVDEHRQDVLEANDGTIQGFQFLPTTLLHYVRPDALGLDGEYPWIDFPARAVVVGDVVMDQVDAASSVPAAMPALSVAAGVGLVAVARRRVRSQGVAAAIAGSGAALVVTLAIGFVAHRYTADAVPLLVVSGGGAMAAMTSFRARRQAFAVGAFAVLVIASVAVTAALTVQFGKHYGFLTAPSVRADLAATQLDAPSFRGSSPVLRVATELPHRVAPNRTFAIVGDCDGLYRSDGFAWQPLERTAVVGGYRFVATVSGELLRLTSGVVLERVGERVVVRHGDRVSRPLELDDESRVSLDLVADPLLGFIEVRRDGELVLDDYFAPGDGRPRLIDGGAIDLQPVATPVCDQLIGRSS